MKAKTNKAEWIARVTHFHDQLIEIEQRLIPTGLNVFGRAAELKEKADLFRMIASFDRPEHGAPALPALVAKALGLDDGILDEPPTNETRELIDDTVAESISRFCQAGIDSAAAYLNQRANVTIEASVPMFALLEKISAQLESSCEIESLMRALRGEYIAPGPGADIVQNPFVLPTGRNTHAVNPYSVPARAAFDRARQTAEALLSRYFEEHGRYPRALALVLWGLDNIKTQGEGVAQALWLLGVRPVRDALNRATEVEVIPLDELKRPRIDVVMTVSGIFRDLFTPTMALLDKAVRRVAALDEPWEMNYVRRNVGQAIEGDANDFDDAATRVFSNAPGNYGANVNFMVTQSAWENEASLGDLFVTRKCFAYARDSQGRTVEGREAPHLMDAALSRVEATYQNIDSFEVGITDVDHYFEYLGGHQLARHVDAAAGQHKSVGVRQIDQKELKTKFGQGQICRKTLANLAQVSGDRFIFNHPVILLNMFGDSVTEVNFFFIGKEVCFRRVGQRLGRFAFLRLSRQRGNKYAAQHECRGTENNYSLHGKNLGARTRN